MRRTGYALKLAFMLGVLFSVVTGRADDIPPTEWEPTRSPLPAQSLNRHR